MRGVVGLASPLALAVAFALGAALLAFGAGFASARFAAARFGAGFAAGLAAGALTAARFGAALGAAAAFGAAFALGAAAALGLAVALGLGSALGLGAALALAAAVALGCAGARRFGLSSAGVGLRAMAASSLSIHHGCKAAALIAVAEAACSRAGTKHHLAGLVARFVPASNAAGGQRCRRSTEAAAPCRARRVQPGRGSTASGVECAMRRHDFQRGS